MLAAIYIGAGVALFGVMRARPDTLPGPRNAAGGSMIGQMLAVLRRRWALTVILVVALEGGMFWGAFTFVSTDLHQRFGLGFAAIGLAVAAFGGGGFLYVMVAHHLVRLLGERGLCTWGGSGLGIAFALMALAPTAEVEFAAIVLSGISFYMFHNTLQTNGTQIGARGARRGHGAVRSLPLYRPGDRRAHRRPDRRPLGCAAGILGGRRRAAGAGVLVRGGAAQAAPRAELVRSRASRYFHPEITPVPEK